VSGHENYELAMENDNLSAATTRKRRMDTTTLTKVAQKVIRYIEVEESSALSFSRAREECLKELYREAACVDSLTYEQYEVALELTPSEATVRGEEQYERYTAALGIEPTMVWMTGEWKVKAFPSCKSDCLKHLRQFIECVKLITFEQFQASVHPSMNSEKGAALRLREGALLHEQDLCAP